MNTITRDELKRRLDKDRNVKLIDVLAPEDFGSYHIPGAANAPLQSNDFDGRIRQLAPDKAQTVVVYCKSTSCNASRLAAERMERLGYTNIFVYEGGKEEWRQAGLPVESGAAATS